MIEITLDDSDLQRGLSQLLRNATQTAPMMRGMAQELESLTKDNFASESWGGDKWPQSKAAAANSRKTLYATGELHDSISTQSGKGYARIGSNIKYAAIHHFGGTVKAKNKPYLMIPVGDGFRKVKQVQIPARPYLPLNADGQLQPGGENKLLQVALDALSKGV